MEFNQGRLEGGRELTKGAKQGTSEHPLITIITSTFNAANDLHWTIESIRSQSYKNIQWVIADGGSSDGTIELLKANEDIIDFWFSESDKGIYDAWNKALPYIKGDWVQFLGAGDEIASGDTISKVSTYLNDAFPDYELVYGNIEIISQVNRSSIEKIAVPWSVMKKQWLGIRPALPMHPEVFHHRSIFDRVDFSSFKIAGDSYILLSSVLYKDPLYLNILIDKMPLGGVSTNPKSLIKMYEEIKQINNIFNIKPSIFRSVKEFLKIYLKFFIMNIFGRKVFLIIGDVFRFFLNKRRKWTIK